MKPFVLIPKTPDTREIILAIDAIAMVISNADSSGNTAIRLKNGTELTIDASLGTKLKEYLSSEYTVLFPDDSDGTITQW